MKIRNLTALIASAFMAKAAAQTVDSVITNRLIEPYNVAVVANTYYISDSGNDRIVVFNPENGDFSTLAGFAGRPGAINDKGVRARFFNPRGLVSVPARSGLVVADYGNHALRLVKPDGTVTTLAGTLTVPGFDATHFNFPSALAVDSAGNIFIADTKNNAIRKLDLSGLITTVLSGLHEPNGIAVGDNGDLWISDTRDQTIKYLPAGGTQAQVVAGTPGQSGALDSIFAEETFFNLPGALLWLGNGNGLVVCDSGNHALRLVEFDPEIADYSVSTYAGTLTQPGFVNGPALQSKFKSPASVVKDPSGGFLIADLGNNAIRRIQLSTPLPPVSNPTIGWVDLQKDSFGDTVSKLVPVTQAVFNNDVTIAILAEDGTETYFTSGPTPASSLEDTIPAPNSLTGKNPPHYANGLSASEVAGLTSLIQPQPDVTIKAIGTQDGRRPSAIVQARFQFKTANPSILGDNAASFVVTNITSAAEMWYTTDGSEPSANGPTSTNVAVGKVSLPRSPFPIPFQIRAFRDGFKPSQIVSNTFLPENYQANTISFGFGTGEASSDFVAAPGQAFYAPVTLSLLPGETMYSLQFNLTVANANAGPSVDSSSLGFESMLMQKTLDTNGVPVFKTIVPALFLGIQSGPPIDSDGHGDLTVTNSNSELLAVGWLERSGKTNLYNSAIQDLITYSIAHDTLFLSSDKKVVVGAYHFDIPSTADVNTRYQIEINRPSATTDGIRQDSFIETVPDPSKQISSTKIVTMAQRQYLVGDAAPFRWLNAGDFGNGFLLNNDVLQVFNSAIYGLNTPPVGSDFFDAMDSCNGVTNALASNVFSGDDTAIDDIKFGDHFLNVDDVYVTFRRSLDPSRIWYARHWEGGQLVAVAVPNTFRGSPDQPGERLTISSADQPGGAMIPGDPAVSFTVDDLQATPGQALELPVRSRLVGSYPIRVLMLGVTIEPLDGSAPLEQAVEFVPPSNLGDPTLTTSRSINNFAGAWLNNKVAGVAGDSAIGKLRFIVPTNASPSAAYRIHFDHVSASPNGIGLFPKQVHDGLITLKDRSLSTAADGIPDTWRLRYFGSISNILSQATADADGDGASNLAEFKAGTNPVDPTSYFGVAAHAADRSRPLTLRWQSMPNKSYVVEAAPSVTSANWVILASGLPGTGQEMQFSPNVVPGSSQFFRVRIAE